MSRCRPLAAEMAALLSTLVLLPLPSRSADAQSVGDEALLREAKVGTDGPALLAFFRERTLSEADRERLNDLVRQLDSDDFKRREKASAALVARGPLAVRPGRKC